jgi:hypothetical protein
MRRLSTSYNSSSRDLTHSSGLHSHCTRMVMCIHAGKHTSDKNNSPVPFPISFALCVSLLPLSLLCQLLPWLCCGLQTSALTLRLKSLIRPCPALCVEAESSHILSGMRQEDRSFLFVCTTKPHVAGAGAGAGEGSPA